MPRRDYAADAGTMTGIRLRIENCSMSLAKTIYDHASSHRCNEPLDFAGHKIMITSFVMDERGGG